MEDLSISEMVTILKRNYSGHLAYIFKGRPSSVPIKYHFNDVNDAIISYSAEGHKMDTMRENSLAHSVHFMTFRRIAYNSIIHIIKVIFDGYTRRSPFKNIRQMTRIIPLKYR